MALQAKLPRQRKIRDIPKASNHLSSQPSPRIQRSCRTPQNLPSTLLHDLRTEASIIRTGYPVDQLGKSLAHKLLDLAPATAVMPAVKIYLNVLGRKPSHLLFGVRHHVSLATNTYGLFNTFGMININRPARMPRPRIGVSPRHNETAPTTTRTPPMIWRVEL